ncbi:hypothetical protein [Eubacterium sp. 1001713B170207_170306_E7]|uniref:hypothetical protein n=1 Tax=Eubacterium sp. 1001713B170207_170306_E7 TaxID=2787097 RepID=UPI00189B435F|nr:hypothetical protein [Eubacterium sp. 1001713B170207_170306_E7]
MNLTEAMVRIADLEAEKEELTNQVGDLTVEKDGYLEELNQIKEKAKIHMKEIQDTIDGKRKVTTYIRDAYMSSLGELFLLNLITFEQFSTFNEVLSALECE